MTPAPLPPYSTMGALLADQAWQQGDKTALIFGDRRTSFAELDEHATALAGALVRHGCGPGTIVGALARNSDRYCELLFGAGRAGSATLTFNWRLARPELETIADEANIRALFFDTAFAEKARNLQRRNPDLLLVALEEDAGIGISYEGFRASGSGTALPDVTPDMPAVILYTSGTTGKAKGVLISHHGLLDNLAQLHMAHGEAGATAGDVALLSPPIFHIGGPLILLGTTGFGGTLVVVAEAKVDDIVGSIARHRITRAVIIPALMPALVAAVRGGTDLSSLRTILYGMSPIPEAVLSDMVSVFDCRFMQSYGMTEVSGSATLLPPSAHRAGGPHLTSCGPALPGTQILIRGLDGAEAATGEPGEVLIRTPSLAVGLLQDGQAKPVPLEDGWYATGDIGLVDAEGYLFLRDRKKDMIISGGENVYSAEVESALSEHPDIERIAVIGVPSDKWGEEVKAVILLKPGLAPDAPSILAFGQARLAKYKVPKSIDFIDEMPVTSVGKIAKNVLRERYWAGYQRQIN